MTDLPPVIYLSGPIRAKTLHRHLEHILEARKVALRLWKLGFAPICPHLNTFFFDGELSYEEFLLGDFALMERSDGILLLPGWLDSEGAKKEREYALEHGIRVFYTLEELLDAYKARDL